MVTKIAQVILIFLCLSLSLYAQDEWQELFNGKNLDGWQVLNGNADYQVENEIIIGVRRRSKVGKLLFGSNAQYIILMAQCPVVAVK